jgi:hypothetical protein
MVFGSRASLVSAFVAKYHPASIHSLVGEKRTSNIEISYALVARDFAGFAHSVSFLVSVIGAAATRLFQFATAVASSGALTPA